NILNDEKNISALEVSLLPTANINKVQQEIKSKMGEKFSVNTRLEQHSTIYRIMKSEKWAVFLILAFILLIATFNVMGSLTMLIIEKQHDIAILNSMGADASLIRRIFFAEGFFITVTGAIAGLVIGTIVCLLQ